MIPFRRSTHRTEKVLETGEKGKCSRIRVLCPRRVVAAQLPKLGDFFKAVQLQTQSVDQLVIVCVGRVVAAFFHVCAR
jgi:hypothetical protein